MLFRARRLGFTHSVATLVVGTAGLWALTGVPRADSADVQIEPVIRVEEDWILVVNEPDYAVDSPQFHTVMSPDNHIDSYYAQVTWNYKENQQYQ